MGDYNSVLIIRANSSNSNKYSTMGNLCWLDLNTTHYCHEIRSKCSHQRRRFLCCLLGYSSTGWIVLILYWFKLTKFHTNGSEWQIFLLRSHFRDNFYFLYCDKTCWLVLGCALWWNEIYGIIIIHQMKRALMKQRRCAQQNTYDADGRPMSESK